MESSRRAVESYWRSRLIDSATSDDDKVTPVYKLDEICELLRSSHPSIVKEVSGFILKRLDHKSPIVKHKALRLIKYAVGKCGAEFRREMQRRSVAVRQLFHYKGQLDPLKGDALNKAVRDTAHEAISAIFSEEDNKPAQPAENLNKRIQGFGNTNFQMHPEDKKSFLSEAAGIGTASIKRGLGNLTQGHSLIKNETGTYKSPNLQRSLTFEAEHGDRYEPVAYRSETQSGSGLKNQSSGTWDQDSSVTKMGMSNEDSNVSYPESKTREDRLLDTIVTSGGVRLQPTRDAIQVFLTEAAKLDALALCYALELRLQSPMWQVRLKAFCVLESILRMKDDDHFSRMASYFAQNKDAVLKCSESPQSSLREKANKILGLFGGGQLNSCAINSEKAVKAESATVAQLPDLIDTGDSNDYHGMDYATRSTSDQNIANLILSSPLVDDLFGDFGDSGVASNELKNDDDPFADVSFHTSENKEHADDLFLGMTVGDDKRSHHVSHSLGNISEPASIDVFASNSGHRNNSEIADDLLAGLSIHENASSTKQRATSPVMQSESFSGLNNHFCHLGPENGFSGMLGSHAVGFNVNPTSPTGHLPYAMRPGSMLNQPYSSQPLDYGAVRTLLAQQQFLATMTNFQHLRNVNMQDDSVGQIAAPNGRTPLPDIFQSNFSTQVPSSMINGSKKEDTKAFDFISDHLAAAYDPRRVI